MFYYVHKHIFNFAVYFVTQASISRWEANQNSISGENLKKLAEYFKVSANSILGLD